jgi:hypothetical protein
MAKQNKENPQQQLKPLPIFLNQKGGASPQIQIQVADESCPCLWLNSPRLRPVLDFIHKVKKLVILVLSFCFQSIEGVFFS